jgi:hypothetical protein
MTKTITTQAYLIPWSDVQAGDTVLHYGHLTRVQDTDACNLVQKGRRSVLLDGSWYYPRADELTAVQRSKEGNR